MTDDVTSAARDAVRYVIDRGLAQRGAALTAVELTGGVSGQVTLVRGVDTGVVVKRALAQLHVAQVWTAKPERALTEAAAMAVYGALTPSHTPFVLDVDTERLTFTMTAAPASWHNWKTLLLAGDPLNVDAACGVAAVLGSVLGTWHRETWHDAGLAARFDDYEAFDQLRVTPFHRVTAEHHPQLCGVLDDCAAELLSRRDCLVHGDFSPKNVLVGDGSGSGVWVLDFEVAHVGAAVFDLAFVHSHLILKALHRPEHAGAFATIWAALLSAYGSAMRGVPVPERIAVHTAALLLARLDGRSPAGYLSDDAAERVRAVAIRTLSAPDRSVDDLWSDVSVAAARGAAVAGGVRP